MNLKSFCNNEICRVSLNNNIYFQHSTFKRKISSMYVGEENIRRSRLGSCGRWEWSKLGGLLNKHPVEIKDQGSILVEKVTLLFLSFDGMGLCMHERWILYVRDHLTSFFCWLIQKARIRGAQYRALVRNCWCINH